MSESSDDWKAWREDSQKRRGENRLNSPLILNAEGIGFVSHNHEAHLVVQERWDFWPGTGLWYDRQTRRKGRGVRRLIGVIRSVEARS